MVRFCLICLISTLYLGTPCMAAEEATDPPVQEETAAECTLLPGAVSPDFLGFGSTPEDVQRIMGKPRRISSLPDGREQWLYGLSTITLEAGHMVGWCPFDVPIPVDLGRPQKPEPVLPGADAAGIVRARGTPRTVADFGEWQIWFYQGTEGYTLYRGVLDHAGVNLTIPPPAPAGKPGVWTGPQQATYPSVSTNTSGIGDVHVRSYFRKDGTFVRSHYRSRRRQ